MQYSHLYGKWDLPIVLLPFRFYHLKKYEIIEDHLVMNASVFDIVIYRYIHTVVLVRLLVTNSSFVIDNQFCVCSSCR